MNNPTSDVLATHFPLPRHVAGAVTFECAAKGCGFTTAEGGQTAFAEHQVAMIAKATSTEEQQERELTRRYAAALRKSMRAKSLMRAAMDVSRGMVGELTAIEEEFDDRELCSRLRLLVGAEGGEIQQDAERAAAGYIAGAQAGGTDR